LPGGMWELPHTECEQSKHQSIRDIAERLGTTLQTAGASRQRSHAIMNYRLTLVVQKCVADGAIRPDLDHRWLEPQQAENAAIASATRKLLQALS
ncbi:MAG: NUDIX domain-containing protein, partial [Planctomycetes bacterium]|nr:NUDIX domain-containing protein [Planctomycetota bacterium]